MRNKIENPKFGLDNLFLKPISFLISFFILFCLASTVPAQDDDPIDVEYSLVVVNATITDVSGKPLFGLKEAQFKVFDNGQEQKLDLFEAAKTPFAAVILLDTSGSMEQRISMARSAAINFLDGLRAEDVAAIYNFDTKVSLVQDFSNSRDITERIFNIKADGGTALNDAIVKAAEQLGKRAEKRRAVIVLSDGADNHSKYSDEKALKAAMAANATIYTIDMSATDTGGKDRIQSQGALKNYAEKSGGVFVTAAGGAAMREAFKNIVEELGLQYTLGYQPLNLKKDGKFHQIEVRVARPNLIIRTRKGYYAAKESKKS